MEEGTVAVCSKTLRKLSTMNPECGNTVYYTRMSQDATASEHARTEQKTPREKHAAATI